MKIKRTINGGVPNRKAKWLDVSAMNIAPDTVVATSGGTDFPIDELENFDTFNVDQTDADSNEIVLLEAIEVGAVINLIALDTVTIASEASSGVGIDGQADTGTITVNAGAFVILRKTSSTTWISEGVTSAATSGTVNTGSTALESGNDVDHVTTITVDTTLPAIAGGADLAVGKLLYTFPAGVIVVKSAYINLAIQETDGNIDADTPDGGLGTTIASGVVNVLGGTAAFENILTGQTFNDCSGTAEVKTVATTLVIEAADAHTVYFNVADGWAASGDAAAELAGTVVIEWTKLT